MWMDFIKMSWFAKHLPHPKHRKKPHRQCHDNGKPCLYIEPHASPHASGYGDLGDERGKDDHLEGRAGKQASDECGQDEQSRDE